MSDDRPTESYGRADGSLDIEISYEGGRYRFHEAMFDEAAIELGLDLEVYVRPASCAQVVGSILRALAKSGWVVEPPAERPYTSHMLPPKTETVP